MGIVLPTLGSLRAPLMRGLMRLWYFLPWDSRMTGIAVFLKALNAARLAELHGRHVDSESVRT